MEPQLQILEGDALEEAVLQSECLANGLPMVRDYGEFQGLDVKGMFVDFTIVTRGTQLNRHGNKVQIVENEYGGGLKLDSYASNPVVFFDHALSGLSLPIAKSESPDGKLTVKLYQSKADARAYFSQTLPEAAQIFALIDEGILRTASIGFLPQKAVVIKQKPAKSETTASGDEILDLARPWVALDFLESELLEWSIVGVPADPGAVRKCLELGKIGQERITDRLRYSLRQMAGNRKVSSPGFTMRVDNNAESGITEQNSKAPEQDVKDDAAKARTPEAASTLLCSVAQQAVESCLNRELEKLIANQESLERRLSLAAGRVV
jgi:hypothetical protein